MSEQKRRECQPWLGPDGTYNHRHDCTEVPDDPRHVRESAELTASTDRIRDEEAQDARQETQRDVFEALLEDALSCEAYNTSSADRFYAEAAPIKRAEWLQRFDVAATRTAALDVFVEALSERLKDWVKEKAVEATQWKSVKDELPPINETILFYLKHRRYSSIEYGYHNGEQWSTYEIHGEVGRHCLPGDEEVTHWRRLPAPPALPALPMEVLK